MFLSAYATSRSGIAQWETIREAPQHDGLDGGPPESGGPLWRRANIASTIERRSSKARRPAGSTACRRPPAIDERIANAMGGIAACSLH
jgi:hypothetical protein